MSRTGLVLLFAVGILGALIGMQVGERVYEPPVAASSTNSATTSGTPANEMSKPVSVSAPWAPVVSGLVGGVLGVAGSLGAQLIIAGKERGQRVDDRSFVRVDRMLEALEVLDAAYVEDQETVLPTPQQQAQLTAAKAKFDRAVGLIPDRRVRDCAATWQNLAEQYALTVGEPDAGGPGAQEVKRAQDELTLSIRGLSSRLR